MEAKASSERLAGLAHVATLSFLAARMAPPIGFGITLAGGLAMARAGQRGGARLGYGAGLGALLETVAIVGPTRLGGAISQAATAPLLGRMEGRQVSACWQVLACAALRVAYNAATTAFFIWVVAGGLDPYAGTYDALLGRLPLLPGGPLAALCVTLAGLLGWALFAGLVQVRVYRRGLRRWPEPEPALGPPSAAPPASASRRRFDPRAIAAGAIVAFGLLVARSDWTLLAAVAVWLGAVWIAAPPSADVLPSGAALAAVLGLTAFAISAVGGSGWSVALAHASRAALLVAVATWMRGAAGRAGFREVVQRTLRRLGAIPAVPEAAMVLDRLGSGRRLGGAARSLIDSLGSVRRRPMAIVDSVLDWVAHESVRFRTVQPSPPLELALRPADALLVAAAALPLLTWIL